MFLRRRASGVSDECTDWVRSHPRCRRGMAAPAELLRVL